MNAELEECLARQWGHASLNTISTKLQTLLVLGNNFSLSTGVFRPISHYLNFLYHLGGIRLCSVQLKVDASPKTIDDLLENHDIVVINGLQQICNVIHLADAVKRRTQQRPVHGYLHETRWILTGCQRSRSNAFAPSCPPWIFLCCDRQIDDFAAYGSPQSNTVIHNPTLRSSPLTPHRSSRRAGQILMSGSVKSARGLLFTHLC